MATANPLDTAGRERDDRVMDPAALQSTTPLAFEIVANDQDGMRVELQTIGEAAQFITSQFIGERVEATDWKHAAASLEAASVSSALVKQATEAVRALLETEDMLCD